MDKKSVLIEILKKGIFFERMKMKGSIEHKEVVIEQIWQLTREISYIEKDNKEQNIEINLKKDGFIKLNFRICPLDDLDEDLNLLGPAKDYLNENEAWLEIKEKVNFYIKLNNKLPVKNIKAKTIKI